MKPDPATLTRITNLAKVGAFLFQISDENAEDTQYFLAKTALEDFKEGIHELELPLDVLDGMDKLIKYLNTKLEKRLKQEQGAELN